MGTKQEPQEIVIDPPTPHSDKQRFLFTALQYPNIREIWCACGTKFGKTLGGTVAQIQYAISRPMTKHRWVAPIYSQTRQPLEYFQRILPAEPHTKRNKSENTIEMPTIKSRFEFWHAQNPASLEGDGIHSYVFDEAAKQPPEIRASARTTTTRTKGPMIFISYPFGKNWFYTGCMEAKEHMEWAVKNNKTIEKVFLHARTIDNPTIDPQVIENARRELSNNLFRQYYLAEFVDEFTVFGDIEPCVFGNRLDIFGDVQQWYADGHKEAHVVIGGDWAKSIDFTVFIAIDMKNYRVCGAMRFQKRAYTEAVRLLAIFSRRFASVEMIVHDKTGVGVAIDEQIAYIGQPFQGVTLTNALKSEFVLKLITAIEQKQIGLPNWTEMKNELKSYECQPTRIGTMSYNAASGKHDDIVCALFLANYAYLLYCEQNFEVKYLDELMGDNKNKSDLERYYLDIIDDEYD